MFFHKNKKNRGVIITIAALCSTYAMAEEPSDTTVHDLQEVTIEGQNQTATVNGLTFSPTATQKKSAHNAYDLLDRLSIPLLNVSTLGKSITMVTGENVAVFINNLPADQYELSSLKPTDVLRVEYLDFPSDPRFAGAQHVVNYIVRKKDWGGYTRLSMDATMLNQFVFSPTVYTKFADKSMTYDLHVNWHYRNSHHAESYQQQRFSLLDENNQPYDVERVENTDYARYRQHNLPVVFRALYDSKKFQASNTLSFYMYDLPEYVNNGMLSIFPDLGTDYTYTSGRIANNYSGGWNGLYYLALSHGYDVSLRGSFNYARNKGNNNYSTDLPGEHPIITDSKEDAYALRFTLTGRKRFNPKTSVSVDYTVGSRMNDVDYSGSSVYSNRFRHVYMFGMLVLDKATDVFNLHAGVGAGWSRDAVNKKPIVAWDPVVHLSLSYVPTSRHRLNLFGQLATNSPGASGKSANIIQQNELLYQTGNPLLKPWRHITLDLKYTWLPRHNFNGTAFFRYYNEFDTEAVQYTHYDEGSALLRKPMNSGDWIDIRAGLSVTYRPIQQLQINGSAGYCIQKRTGIYKAHLNDVYWSASANYYIGNFYCTASFASRTKDMLRTTATTLAKNYYYIGAGWGNSIWNVSLYAANLFSGDWRSSSVHMNTPLFVENYIPRDGNYHRSLHLSVSYVINYGKKLQRNNEVGLEGESGVPSAIM